MQIHPLRELDAASEALLRARAELRGRDPDESVAQISTALAAGRIEVAALLADDAESASNTPTGIAAGIAAWRWSDQEQAYAQVLFLHIPPESPPAHSALLADHIVQAITAAPTLRVIEARLRDESPGVGAAWRQHDFVIFERCRMRRALGQNTLLPLIPIPSGYHLVPWDEERVTQAESVASAAHAAGVEPVAVPAMMQHHLATLRRARLGPDWIDPASSIALNSRDQVVGYSVVTRGEDEASIVDLAVHPQHRENGLASALLIRALRACLRQNIPAITAIFTLQNPIQLLFNRLSFQPTDCGQIAIWWHDRRQLAWLE